MNIKQVRKNFPILQTKVNNKPLVYLDNAATTQRPRCVVEAIDDFYFNYNSNVHRGVYFLAECATSSYEQTRNKIGSFINARKSSEVVFVKGATEGINLVAQSYGGKNLKEGDEVVISTMEHHSNIVPWQVICNQTGAKLRVININKDNGELDLEHYEDLLTDRTKLVAVTHVSNTLGVINPIKEIISTAHNYNIPVLVDGSQAAPHIKIDVQDLQSDFYVFSSHKMYGPTGVGVLYGREELLDLMPPYQTGGDMIKKVTFTATEYADLPQKFEAGTQNIAGVIGFGVAVDFLNSVGLENIALHEQQLLKYIVSKLSTIKSLKIIGNATMKVGIVSFVLENIHPHDLATIFDSEGVAVRAGHHCNMPLMDFYGIPGTVRVSFGMYNTEKEIDTVILALDKAKKIFGCRC